MFNFLPRLFRNLNGHNLNIFFLIIIYVSPKIGRKMNSWIWIFNNHGISKLNKLSHFNILEKAVALNHFIFHLNENILVNDSKAAHLKSSFCFFVAFLEIKFCRLD
jgi:hypothetical protein